MASESFHEDPQLLSEDTRDMHRALVSLTEELDAVDWYRQRANACGDPALADILLHHMREEMEHAAMLIEWLRRRDADFSDHLKDYLYTTAPITAVEERQQTLEAAEPAGDGVAAPPGLTIGSLKE